MPHLRRWLGPGVLAVLVWCHAAAGQDEHLYLTTNTLVARALAMAGAYAAMEDELPAGLYNPANAGGYRFAPDQRFKLFLNPLTPAVALSRSRDFFGESRLTLPHTLAALGLALKGFTLRAGPFDLAAILAEQSSRFSLLAGQPFAASGYLDNQYHVLALRMRVAERVALGGSVGLYYVKLPHTSRVWRLRASYGITLAPSRSVLLGVSYLTVPTDDQGSQRDHPERLVEGGVNLGVSYRPAPGTTLALEVRNLVEDNQSMVREPHVGMEQNIAALVALRLGAFHKREQHELAWTAGMGLLDTNWRFSKHRRYLYPNWALNYGVVAEKSGRGGRRFIHVVTVLFRL